MNSPQLPLFPTLSISHAVSRRLFHPSRRHSFHLCHPRPTHTPGRPFLSLPPLLAAAASAASVTGRGGGGGPFSCHAMSIEAPESTPQLQDSLSYSRAYWVTESLIAWDVDGDFSCYLYASRTASFAVTEDGIQGYEEKIKLEQSSGLPAKVIEKFPHIRDFKVYQLPPDVDVRPLLKCQLAVATSRSDGRCCNVTGLQLPGVLDELFSYTGPLGAVFLEDAISFHLWAPTAQNSTSKLAFTAAHRALICWKLSRLRRLMGFGGSEAPHIGRAAIMSTKFAYIIPVPCASKTALQMILMREGSHLMGGGPS